MNYCIVENGVIENIIVCEDDATAAQFGALPSYDGADIGTPYDPPPSPPEPIEYTETQILGQQLTDLELLMREYIASQSV